MYNQAAGVWAIVHWTWSIVLVILLACMGCATSLQPAIPEAPEIASFSSAKGALNSVVILRCRVFKSKSGARAVLPDGSTISLRDDRLPGDVVGKNILLKGILISEEYYAGGPEKQGIGYPEARKVSHLTLCDTRAVAVVDEEDR